MAEQEPDAGAGDTSEGSSARTSTSPRSWAPLSRRTEGTGQSMATHSLQIETDNNPKPLKDDNPVRKYLRSLVWDDVPRLNKYTASEHEIGA